MSTTPSPLPLDPTRAFQPTADPASLWLTGQYDDALRMLRSAALGRQGLLVLVGESGTGKTVLAHALATRLRDDTVVVGRLLYPILEGMDLLAAVAEAFGLSLEFRDRDSFAEQFRRFVAETLASGRRVLLIVDEAQRLSPELLVELGRLPYADGSGDAASLSVLLVGQRSLLDTLRAEAVEPDVLCYLRPLTREQTAEYIAHRLRVIRHRGRLFTPSALRKIWIVSEGIPQVANALCVDALSTLRPTGRRTVTAAMIDRSPRGSDEAPAPETALTPIDEASVELPPQPPARTRRRPLASLVGAACIVLTLVAIWAVKRSDRVPAFLAGPVETTASTVTDVTTEGENEPGAAAPAEGLTDAVLASNSTGPVALPPPALPERERSTSIASRPRVAVPPAKSARAAADNGDATIIIDWLLEKHRPRGDVR